MMVGTKVTTRTLWRTTLEKNIVNELITYENDP